MSELLDIDQEITGKYSLGQTDRISLLNRLMVLADEYPAPVIADVLVRALEREVWRLSPQQDSEYLNLLIDALNKFQWTFTSMWKGTAEDEHSSPADRADKLETALCEESFTDEERVQVIFNNLKGAAMQDLDARWDVLHGRFASVSPKVQFAMAYAICVNCSNDSRHPMFELAVRLVADAALNPEDKSTFADALIALRSAQGTSLAADAEENLESHNRKFISRFK
jgi:hypothetical protein